jgi:hypothetical protein
MENLLTSFAGFSNVLLGRCTGTTKSRAALLGAVLLIVAFISSTLACVSAHFIWGASLLTLLPLFAIWFFFIYLFDRGILQTQRDGWMIVTRICMAFLLAGLHAYFIDLMVFSRDIDLALFDENKTRSESIEKKYQPAIETINSKISELDSRQVLLHDNLSQWRNDLKKEADGTGGSFKRGVANIYAEKYKLFAQDSINAVMQLKEINSKIIWLNSQKDSLSHIAKDEITVSPNLREQAGVAKRLEKAHEIVFAKGNWLMRVFYFIIFFIAMFIELLPAILKYSIDLNELHQMENREMDDSVKCFHSQSESDLNMQLSRIVTTQTQNMASETSAHAQKMLEVQLEEIRHKYEKVRAEFEHYDKEYTVLVANAWVYKDELEANIRHAVTEVSNL